MPCNRLVGKVVIMGRVSNRVTFGAWDAMAARRNARRRKARILRNEIKFTKMVLAMNVDVANRMEEYNRRYEELAATPGFNEGANIELLGMKAEMRKIQVRLRVIDSTTPVDEWLEEG